ncbi:hypothetical protein OGATHE_005644 [Ogataea polymorpha]|uniref:Uncharacterized protein n=1 Tax=Ogataea polymorpha TaxID=460523 RepID=A0A9P8SZ10_9ASCO|nr:hypothetical protein OGATHE_005644 [Ogataea polymorpha]
MFVGVISNNEILQLDRAVLPGGLEIVAVDVNVEFVIESDELLQELLVDLAVGEGISNVDQQAAKCGGAYENP